MNESCFYYASHNQLEKDSFDTKQFLPIGILIKAIQLAMNWAFIISKDQEQQIMRTRHAIMVIMGNFCEVNDEQTI